MSNLIHAATTVAAGVPDIAPSFNGPWMPTIQNITGLALGTFLVILIVAVGIGVDPMLLAIPVALAATSAFMLPVATPPNAVSYASGYITIGQMMRGGFWLNLIAISLITIAAYTVFAWSLGIQF